VEVWELIARESIRDLVARYNANGDSGRIDALMQLFSEDATLEIRKSRVYRGASEIRTLFEGAAARPTGVGNGAGPSPPAFIRHHTSTHQIDIETPDRASGRCYFAVYTDAGLDHWGRYADQYYRLAGKWIFQSRRVTVEARVPGGWGDLTSRRLHGD
jgi:hypothetical protein